VYSRALQTNLSAAVATITAGAATVSPRQILILEANQQGLTSPRFQEVRVKRIEVWGSGRVDVGGAQDVEVVLIATESDGFKAQDFGVYGATRSHVAIEPNLKLRDTWYTGDNSNGLFQILSGAIKAEGGSDVIYRLTCDFR